jgi:hypothetical protein
MTETANKEIDYRLIMAMSCDITLILGITPDNDLMHPMWPSETGPFKVGLCHHEQSMSICDDDMLREEYLALVGVSKIYDYTLTEVLFEEIEIDADMFQQQQHKHTH